MSGRSIAILGVVTASTILAFTACGGGKSTPTDAPPTDVAPA